MTSDVQWTAPLIQHAAYLLGFFFRAPWPHCWSAKLPQFLIASWISNRGSIWVALLMSTLQPVSSANRTAMFQLHLKKKQPGWCWSVPMRNNSGQQKDPPGGPWSFFKVILEFWSWISFFFVMPGNLLAGWAQRLWVLGKPSSLSFHEGGLQNV